MARKTSNNHRVVKKKGFLCYLGLHYPVQLGFNYTNQNGIMIFDWKCKKCKKKGWMSATKYWSKRVTKKDPLEIHKSYESTRGTKKI